MSAADQVALLGAQQTLPISGAVAPNRFFKAPTEEYLCQLGATTVRVGGSNVAVPGRMPSATHMDLYAAYAAGGWGIIVTGNVMVDPTQLGGPMDIALPPLLPGAAEALEAHRCHADPLGAETAASTASKLYAQSDGVRYMFSRYARAIRNGSTSPPDGTRPLALMQLNHAGRQSMRGSGRGVLEPAWAPSAERIKVFSKGHGLRAAIGGVVDELGFGTPKAMTLADIARLKAQFLSAAVMCQAAGFDGIQIHAAHGYQLAAFLSPLTNKRTDQYGGSDRNRARLLLELADETRALTGPNFVIAVKLNSADYIAGGLTEQDALQTVTWLSELNAVDLIEISGGTYESPVFLTLSQGGRGSTSSAAPPVKPREALFFTFAHESHQVIAKASASAGCRPPMLVITGGLKTRTGMASAVEDAHADFVGVARYASVYPALPAALLGLQGGEARACVKPFSAPMQQVFTYFTPALVGGGWSTQYAAAQMRVVACVHRAQALAKQGHRVRADALLPPDQGVPLLDALEAQLATFLPPAWSWALFIHNWLATGRITRVLFVVLIGMLSRLILMLLRM